MKEITSERIGFKCGGQWALTKTTSEQLLAYAKNAPLVASVDEIERLPGFACYDPNATDAQNFWSGFEGGVHFFAKMKKMEVARQKRNRPNSRN